LALYGVAVALKPTKDKPLFITRLKERGGDAFRENKITPKSRESARIIFHMSSSTCVAKKDSMNEWELFS